MQFGLFLKTKMSVDYFKKALQNFTYDAASLGAVRHLTDLGLSVKEIEQQLDFPTPHDLVKKTVWERLIETGVILLSAPEKLRERTEVHFVREYNAYGKASFRKVTETSHEDGNPDDYLACSFGKLSEEELKKRLEKAALTDSEIDYVLGLPWEKKTVYHKRTDRMREIERKLRSSENPEDLIQPV